MLAHRLTGRVYGGVRYARFSNKFTRDVLVLNSAEVTRVLPEERGVKYSGRPRCTSGYV
ncbi:hypothetical protein FOMPIDRAFT_86204 [Fomitopsis schrenkii]|uniref:Uncharacterized protein n=1 Tax=Fomitopsis schrenkii TaxID=2126942 RepID=S8FHR5_FOMSC|nr:hypothetical protein FOMPIDRAFT_86204 [Fomitopsis schrenkii]